MLNPLANNIGNEGAVEVAKSLRVNTTLTDLNIESKKIAFDMLNTLDNRIEDAGSKEIAESLQHNSRVNVKYQ